jgi:hypothetical protein
MSRSQKQSINQSQRMSRRGQFAFERPRRIKQSKRKSRTPLLSLSSTASRSFSSPSSSVRENRKHEAISVSLRKRNAHKESIEAGEAGKDAPRRRQTTSEHS